MNLVTNPGESTRFITFAQITATERLRVLSYLSWITTQDVFNKILSHPLYAPSAIWKNWTSDTFLGFSADKLMLKSGHNFGVSFDSQLMPFPDKQETFMKVLKQAASLVLARLRQDRSFTREELSRAFLRCYPKATFFDVHDRLLALHPGSYFRAMEGWVLREVKAPRFQLEIGAGAGANLALSHSVYNDLHSVVIDLPETIYAAYLFLSSFNPSLKICLPHEVDDSWAPEKFDISFLLPFQTERIPNDQMNLALNASSFQEMGIETVNHYLALIKRTLAPGGYFLSINQAVSRHIRGNSLDAYQLDGFTIQKKVQAMFADWVARTVQGIHHIFLQAQKNQI